MDVDELIKKAWDAVDRAGVPEQVQGIALKEAIDFLRDDDGGGEDQPPKRKQTKQTRRRTPPPEDDLQEEGDVPDADAFFTQLADESGLDEMALRDVLLLKDGVVHVIPPTRKLGASKSQQAARVTALVASAYVHGLGRNAVSAKAVHDEAKRKRCFDPNNYSGKVLGKLKGFSAGSDRTEIVVGSKWLDEFKKAVEAAGDTGTANEDE